MNSDEGSAAKRIELEINGIPMIGTLMDEDTSDMESVRLLTDRVFEILEGASTLLVISDDVSFASDVVPIINGVVAALNEAIQECTNALTIIAQTAIKELEALQVEQQQQLIAGENEINLN